MSIYAVTVVGGAFGSYIAERLSALGWKVALYEKNPRREVVCGGLISNETLRRFPVLEEFVINRIDGAVISSGSEEVLIKRRSVAWVLERTRMFRTMLETAESSGVEVKGRWKGERGKVIVGADGALSEVRKLVTNERVDYILALQGEARWGEDDHYVRVDFGPWSDAFFGWVIPLGDGTAHVGVGVSLKESGGAVAYLDSYARRLGLKLRNIKGRLIPVSRPLRKVSKGTVLLVGDAAVHTKASTGGGIAYGFRGMDLAIGVINSYLGGEASSLEEYNALHRGFIYPRLLVHWAVHRFYNNADMEKVIRELRELGLDRELSKRGSMDDPLFLLSPKFLRLTFRNAVPFLKTLPELF